MSWRVVLLVGTVVAVAIGAVGVWIDQGEINALAFESDVAAFESRRAHPFQQPIYAGGTPNGVTGEATLENGDQAWWYAAAGAVMALTLASLPLLRHRERLRDDRLG